MSFNTTDIGVSTSLNLFGFGLRSGVSIGSGYPAEINYTGKGGITNGIGGFTAVGAAIIIFAPELIPVILPRLAF